MSGGRPLVQTSLLPHISRAPRASNDDDDDCQGDENIIVTKNAIRDGGSTALYAVDTVDYLHSLHC